MSDPVVLGTPLPFSFEGKAYQSHPITYEMEAAFAAHHADVAYREVQRARQRLGPEAHRELMQGYQDRLFAREFSWGTPLSHNFLFTDDGLAYAAFLKLSKAQAPEAPVDQELGGRVVRDRAARKDFVALLLRQDFPPPGPGQAEAPGPS